jgi:formylglycine-generating enzyme required for sulfatase activity
MGEFNFQDWGAVAERTPAEGADCRLDPQGKTAPVVAVTWYEANAYCKWLAEQRELPEWRSLERLNRGGARLELRLPSEAEWVEAAGGEAGGRFAWGELKNPEKEIIRYANTEESGIGRTTPVWMYPQGKSPRGVMELSGNVWEWQANFWDKDHHTLSLRGGSWYYFWSGARVASRDNLSPVDSWHYFGFRLFARPV